MRVTQSIIAVTVFIGFFISCSAPKKWEGSPYISAEKMQLANGDWSLGDFTPGIILPESSRKVRVLLYAGKALPVAAKKYTFRTRSGKTVSGSGKYKPRTEGDFISENGPFYFRGKPYAGELQVRKSGKKIAFINVVNEDEYLVSVVSHEMSPSWPLEALKAQAVVARTYLYQKQKRSGLYDVDSTTNHQVYKGIAKGDHNVRRAVAQSRGEVVTYRKKLAQVFFYSCAGGHTAAASEVWTADLPYLVAQKSDYCKGAPVYRWRTKISKKELQQKLRVASIRKIVIAARSQSRRAKTIKIYTSKGTVIMSGTKFRARLGATRVKSTLFGIRYRKGAFEIAGKGYGHGVGMDQWGSRFLAEKYNRDYRDIISHYFPGTQITRSQAKSSAS